MPPPGVYPSPDGADVAAPVSIIEWFANFYDEARAAKVIWRLVGGVGAHHSHPTWVGGCLHTCIAS
jgi:hypothetical protein